MAGKFKSTPATLTVTRPSNAEADEGRPIIRLYIKVAGVRRSYELTAENFALALTGASETPMQLVEPDVRTPEEER